MTSADSSKFPTASSETLKILQEAERCVCLCAATYEDDPAQRETILGPDLKALSIKNTSFTRVLIADSRDTRYIVFRGVKWSKATVGLGSPSANRRLSEWLSELHPESALLSLRLSQCYPVAFEKAADGHGVGTQVHAGVYAVAKDLYPTVLRAVSSTPPSRPICLVGQSLGGSLALLLRLMLVHRLRLDPARFAPVHTFAALPVISAPGDPATWLPQHGLEQDAVRNFVYGLDIVPRCYTANDPLLHQIQPLIRAMVKSDGAPVLYELPGVLYHLRPDLSAPPSSSPSTAPSTIVELRSFEAQRTALSLPPARLLPQAWAPLADHVHRRYLRAIKYLVANPPPLLAL